MNVFCSLSIIINWIQKILDNLYSDINLHELLRSHNCNILMQQRQEHLCCYNKFLIVMTNFLMMLQNVYLNSKEMKSVILTFISNSLF